MWPQGLVGTVQRVWGFAVENRIRLLSRILRNAGAVVLSRGLLGFLKILALLYVARQLGSSDFGRFSLVLALVEIFRVLSDFGVETVTIRSLARAGPGEEPEILSSSIALKVALACLAYMGIVVVSWGAYHTQDTVALSAIAGLGLFAWTLSSALTSSYQAKLRMAEIVPAHMAGGIVYLAGLTVGASLRWPLGLLVAVLPISECVTLGLSIALYGRAGMGVNTRPCTRHFRLRTIVTVLSLAWPVGLTSLIVVAYFRLDALLIAWLIGEAAVGQYAVAFRITEPFLLLPSAVSVSVYSAASPLWGRRGEEAMQLYGGFLVGAIMYATIMALGLTFFASPILALISPGYVEAASALRVLAWSLVFMSCNLMSTAIINAMGRYRFLIAGGAATLLTNVGLNLLLIPRFGILGASMATVATEAFNFLVQAGYIYTQGRRVAGGFCG